MVRLRAFRAIDNANGCEKFIEGHARVLNSVGVTKVTSATNLWVKNPSSYVILAESEDRAKVFGGARVQLVNDGFVLPIEEALKEKDSRIFDLIHQYNQNTTSELCGLWNSVEVAGMGLGCNFLIRACVVLSKQLGLKSMFALCSPYTARVTSTYGFVVETSIGHNGTFYYPKMDLLATTKVIPNCLSLEFAEPEEREIIFQLMNSPCQTRIENTKRGELRIDYELNL